MKLQSHNNALETNSESQTQEFGIGDPSVIIDILRNRLYEKKIQSLVQEYISNARDSAREAGKADNAFEVTVPTRLSPVFKVRDFGVGITPDRMAKVFIKYGASTKRGTNNQTGGFGIGAKSAWSYTDSFNVITYLDGTRRAYVAHIGTNNAGSLDLVSTGPTTEKNGTEIHVAVGAYDINEFRTAIFRATYFWKDRPTLKGELNEPGYVEGKKVGTYFETIQNELLPQFLQPGSWNEILCVIDGVPYPAGDKLISKVPSMKKLNDLVRGEVILRFGNGLVEVSASRESIADSKYTVENLEKIAAEAHREAAEHVTQTFARITDTKEYLQTYAEMSKVFDVDQFASFGEYKIKNNWIASTLLKKVNLTSVTTLNRRGQKVQKITRNELSEARKEIQISSLPNLFSVTKEEKRNVVAKRLREHLKANNEMILIEPRTVIEWADQMDNNGVIVKDATGNPVKVVKSKTLDMVSFNQVISDLSAKDFHGITYVEEPKIVKAKVKREDAEICLHTFGTRFTHVTLAKNTTEWLYVPFNDSGWEGFTASELRDLHFYLRDNADKSICGIAPKGLSMVEGNENFTPLKDWLKAYVPSKKMILGAMSSLAKNANTIYKLEKYKGIKDSFLTDMIAEYKALTKGYNSPLPSLLSDLIGGLKEVKDFKALDEALTKVMDNDYPLVGELSDYSRFNSEMIFYINAKYEMKKGRK